MVTFLYLSAAGNVNATTLVTENFNYTVGSSLAGQNGGTGFSGPWVRHYSGNADGTIVAGLTFSDYPVSGNAALFATVYPGSNKADDIRPLSANFGAAPQAVWMSCLYSRTLTPGTSPIYYAGLTTINSSNPDDSRFGMGNTNYTGPERFTATYQSAGLTAGSSTIAASTTYLLIGKYVGGTSMALWVLTAANYDSIKAGGITEAELNAVNSDKITDSFAAGDGNTLQSFLRVYSSTYGTNSAMNVTIGNIKMGTTLADVAPEPASSLLVSENFNYPIGSSLTGQNGGMGFSGPWTRHYSGNADGTIVAGLTFSDYPVFGNAVCFAAAYPGNNKADDIRPLSANFGSAPQTVWASCLYSRTLTPGTSPIYYGGMTTINSTNPDDSRFGMGNTNYTGPERFTATYQSTGMTAGTGAIAASITYLLIGKYVGGTNMTLWVLTAANYDSIKAGGITEAELNAVNSGKITDAAVAGDGNTLQSFLRVYSSTYGTNSAMNITVGEVKMGTTLASVDGEGDVLYYLTFDDEFNGLSVQNPLQEHLEGNASPQDTSRGWWRPILPWGTVGQGKDARYYGPTNGEQQGNEAWYVWNQYKMTNGTIPAPDTYTVNNGILTIKTRPFTSPESSVMTNLTQQGIHHWSGILTTFPTFSQQYGYFEMRAKLPTDGKGLFPAFWLLADDFSWPPEIDIFEFIGKISGAAQSGFTNDFQTVHMPDQTQNSGAMWTFPSGRADDGFHVYGLEWLPTRLIWYVDGVETRQIDRTISKPMYLIINNAVGGSWATSPDGTTPWPAQMQIDYVRVYSTTRPTQVMGPQ